MLTWVNETYKTPREAPLFRIQLVGLEKSPDSKGGLFALAPEVLLSDIERTDLIVLPAIHSEFQQSLEDNRELNPWLVKHYKQGAEIVSLCISSFFLASTGLLDGKPCSTHWASANVFRELFPKVDLVDEKIVTEYDGIYTSGGAYAFTNLIIYIIEKYAGREAAILAAKTFMIDIDRSSQSPFMVFAGQRSHNDKKVLKAQDYLERHYHEKISVNDLSEMVSLGRRTFERRFKKATMNSVLEYHQRVRVEAAKRQLEGGRKTVNEVMYEVGYNDAKAFRDVFKKYTDMTPVEYSSKYTSRIFS
ncbi:GlxA family transcriptional regulator [Galbibacter mesophilus]|uniref:GlxA family transcriptional regulator n=1 Tax=Galbibacter mesophilus TaxID=379069 RepID=UPI001F5E175D|nr:helix-turn-helix domain-containing protein [Galbibacter mesophilus]MCM5663638.1 helix-turn-helix domain-containing protein [Galbibacter mesophilus]